MNNDDKFYNKESVESWLEEYLIADYVINKDLSVDVNRDVDISGKELKSLPVQFGVVNGDFDCSDNALTSLEGCPKKVNGTFNCSYNDLTSLKGCPEEVHGGFCAENNKITSTDINSFLNCSFINLNNNEITDLNVKNKNLCNIYADNNNIENVNISNTAYILTLKNNNINDESNLQFQVNSILDLSFNKITNLALISDIDFTDMSVNLSNNRLTSLKGCAERMLSLDISNNELESLEGCPEKIRDKFNCSNNMIDFNSKDINDKIPSGCYELFDNSNQNVKSSINKQSETRVRMRM